MAMSSLKNITRKLSILKDYFSLVVPVIITLAALVVFVVSLLMGSNFKKDIEKQSLPNGKKVKGLLTGVVSSSQWQVEQKHQRAYEQDANDIALLAVQANQRELLSYKIFPEPNETSPLIFAEFGQRFRDRIENLLIGVKAGECPSETELTRNLNRSGGSRGKRYSSKSVRNISEVETAIVEEICRGKAESSQVYISASDLSGYEFWEEYEYYSAGMEKAIEDCWYWQSGYWIIKDVFDTIDSLNAGSDNVLKSPVKRLLEVSFGESGQRASKEKGKGGDGYKPGYILSAGDWLTESLTTRVCNEDIDVVHFNVAVVVSAKTTPLFTRQLCTAKQHKFKGFNREGPDQHYEHNQITILKSMIKSFSRDDSEHSLYRYGEDAVVELDLVCEYIFSKRAYDEIKPESVKKQSSVDKQPSRKMDMDLW